MFQNMTIGKKLITNVAMMLLFTLMLGGFALYSINSLSGMLEISAGSTTQKLEHSQAIRYRFQQMVAVQRGFLISYLNGEVAEATANRQRWQEANDVIAQKVTEMRPLLTTVEGKSLLESIESTRKAWAPLGEEYMKFAAQGDLPEANRVMSTGIRPLITSMEESSERLIEQQRQFLAASREQASNVSTTSIWLTVVLLGLAVVMAVIVVLVARSVSSTLHGIATQLGQGSDEVSSAAGQVSSSSQSLSQAASEQAASLEETSASAEELNSMTQKNAENSREAATQMGRAEDVVREANTHLQQMLKSMDEINASSEKISRIIKVIDEIAFQTNILALNAAVEAARAGEAGMGFAVVADEVRNLAQRSAQAAKDTAELIEDSISRSREGSGKLSEVAAAIEKITDNARAAKTLVDEVNMGSQEQARGIDQIAKAIVQMEQVTHQVAANAEEGASASEQLNAQAETVDQIVGQLRAMVTSHHEGGRQQANRRAIRSTRSKPAGFGGQVNKLGRALGRSARPSVSRGDDGKVHEHAAAPAGASSSRDRFPMDEDFQPF